MLNRCHGRSLIRGVGILIVAVSVVAAGAAGEPAAAARSASSSAFFAMSPIKAVFVPSVAATRFDVTLTGIPPDNHPNFRWSLSLDSPAAGSGARAACENGKLAGDRRTGANKFVWTNQGPSFLWYATGGASCEGIVSVVAENEYEHCTASLQVPLASPELRRGGPASCAVGGYSLGPSTLPVPRGLLKGSAATSAELTRLAGEVRSGAISPARLASALDAVLAREHSSFSNLFPPVFGCSFSPLFEPLVGSMTALDAQREAGTSASGLAAFSTGLSAATKELRSCKSSAGSGGGAPKSVVASLGRIEPPTTRSAAALAASLDAVLKNFPAVFGIPYRRLVDQVAVLNSAVALAKQRVQSGNTHAAAGALATALPASTAVQKALVQHQKRVVKAENANG